MLIDFVKMREIIPTKGSVKIVLRVNGDDKIAVIFESKHKLTEVSSTYEKSLDSEKKEIESATKDLNKVLAFSEHAETLNATFEEQITKRHNSEKSLAEAINEATAVLNESIKALKDKKGVKKPDAKPAAKTGKTEESKKDKPASPGGLFGQVIGGGEQKTSTAADEESGSDDADTEGDEEVQG